MRNHLSLFAACTALLGWSGPVNAQDLSFGGYECTDDCAGHAAGYQWAGKKQITESSECPLGNSDSFYEGCFAYMEDRYRRADQDDEGKPIDAPRSSANR
jgi:hypothetical protein